MNVQIKLQGDGTEVYVVTGLPTIAQSAKWARTALDAFLPLVNGKKSPPAKILDSVEVKHNITDLISDLMHYAHFRGLDAKEILLTAGERYQHDHDDVAALRKAAL